MTILLEEEYAHTSCMEAVPRVVSNPDVVAKAAALRLTLRERARETDRLARLPEATVADLEKTRLFEITTPRRYGGLQLDARTYMDAMVELGRGDASVAWAATLVNINNWFIATLFPPEVSEEVFAKPGARAAAVLQPRSCKVRKVSGGFQIDEGVWPFNSGVYHAQWDVLGFPAQDEAGGYLAFALLPISDVQILDDWDTIGVRGSGSSSVAVRNVFVPDIRISRPRQCPVRQIQVDAVGTRMALPRGVRSSGADHHCVSSTGRWTRCARYIHGATTAASDRVLALYKTA
jgi:3-hydroxy-9,10-secoandrosta-1,3,5(10)-triene-9,17-dione monooxygenase